MKRPTLFFASLVGLAACQSHPSQPTAGTTAKPATRTAPGTAASSPGTAYAVYRGVLPGQADSVTLHLVEAPSTLAATPKTSRFGSYYGPAGQPYTLQGQPTAAPDSVILAETSPEKDPGASGNNLYWRLRRQPATGELAGTIGGHPVRLRLVQPAAGALTFVVRYFADSVVAFPKEVKSPVGRISWQALLPVGGPSGTRNTLAMNMLRDLRGDTLAGLPIGPLEALYKQQRRQFFKTYREDATASRPAPADTAGVGPYGIGLNYETQVATYVLCQQGNLLSLGFLRYDYSGGAHGNYGTTAASYDLSTGRRLRYDAIFLPGAAAQLPALLGSAVRPLVGLAPGDPLDKQLFVQRMPVTHNVLLTPGGAVFIYQPYEIAAYAQGEVRVFVPLAALRPLLRPGLPLPAAGGVAAR